MKNFYIKNNSVKVIKYTSVTLKAKKIDLAKKKCLKDFDKYKVLTTVLTF